ncbi:glycosyl hydrolase family 28-related protein [Paenibacillus sp. Soil522]|uniref:glycosyl hydrolase family 28-related protein n=1 Tax=Paenibacillus sp. Soil522 TaxID=1736388 RepID=UPI0006FC6ECD|nr:glycosyl hydrolase family 28-related protein [Paenibacillus sp. Soil522]KRE38683.1 hypothetical protein ASG81_19910 [Paenibacillus sp. Soil522]
MRERDITAFGAVGDGVSDNTAAIRLAIKACAQAGGGIVRVPAGTYATGPIRMASGITLYLETGATLRPVRRLRADIYTLVRL